MLLSDRRNMAEVLPKQYYNPLQSFLLSSWNNTIGPQILVKWKPKLFSTNDVLNKSIKDKLEISHENLTEGPEGNDSNVKFLDQRNELNQLDNTENKQINCLEEFIYLDDQNNCICSPDITFKAVGQLLLGELESYPALLGSYSRMYSLAEKNIIIITNLFQLNNCIDLNGKSVDVLRLSLSAIFKYEDKEFILSIYTIIDLMLKKQVAILQQHKVLSLDIIKWISMHLNNNYNTISDLYNFSLKDKLSLQETYFGNITANDLKFFERSFASHFQTCNSSIIVGKTETDINKMICTLALFQDEKERSCSTYISSLSKSYSYQPGLFLQGLLKDNYGRSDLWFQDLKLNPYPVTVTDLHQKKVRNSLHFSLICQQGDNYSTTESQSLKEETSLQTVTEAGKLIPDMLHECRIFNENPEIQENYAKHFTRYMWLTASSLVKITDRYRELNITTTPAVLKTILKQSNTTDLKVIIGRAEKLKPGICAVLNEK